MYNQKPVKTIIKNLSDYNQICMTELQEFIKKTAGFSMVNHPIRQAFRKRNCGSGFELQQF